MLNLNRGSNDFSPIEDAIVRIADVEMNPPPLQSSPQSNHYHFSFLFSNTFFVAMHLYRFEAEVPLIKQYLASAARYGLFTHNLRVINKMKSERHVAWDFMRALALNICFGFKEVFEGMAKIDGAYYGQNAGVIILNQVRFIDALKTYIQSGFVDHGRCAEFHQQANCSEHSLDRNVVAPLFSCLSAAAAQDYDGLASQLAKAVELYRLECFDGEFELAPDGCMALMLLMIVKLTPESCWEQFPHSDYLPIFLLR